MQLQPNILIIVQNLPVPFDRRVWAEARSLHKAGYGVAVICPKKNMYRKGFERLEGIEIYRYALPYEANEGIFSYLFEFLYCWFASLCLAIRAYIRRPFRIIHACNPPDTFFALALLFRPLGVRFVFDHHDLCPEMYLAKGGRRKGFCHRGLLLLERLTLRSADRVIAVNRSHRAVALDRGGCNASHVTVVRSGPPQRWAEIQNLNTALKCGRKYLVVYLGEMCQQDGVDHLIRAINHYASSEVHDTLFVLIGGGPDQERVKKMASALGLGEWVTFTGRISDEELCSYLAAADVCVDPDPISEWSNMSTMNKMIEYLAFGKPVVAFDLREHRETAQCAAVYVEGNDDAKFASAIRELLEDAPRRLKMAEFGQHRFRNQLAWENSERELLNVYSQLCNLGLSSNAAEPTTIAGSAPFGPQRRVINLPPNDSLTGTEDQVADSRTQVFETTNEA